MYLKTAVSIPKLPAGITRKTIKGTTYIYYEQGRIYDRDKKYTSPQCTTIGKLCDDDPSCMYPNDNYLKFFPDAELPEELPASSRSGCLKIGAHLCLASCVLGWPMTCEWGTDI